MVTSPPNKKTFQKELNLWEQKHTKLSQVINERESLKAQLEVVNLYIKQSIPFSYKDGESLLELLENVEQCTNSKKIELETAEQLEQQHQTAQESQQRE